MKGRKQIKVTLVNPPMNSVEQLAVVWQQSRSNNELLDAEVLRRLNILNYSSHREIESVHVAVSQADILSWSIDNFYSNNVWIIYRARAFMRGHGDLDLSDNGDLLLLGQTLDDIFLMALDGDFPVIEHAPRLTFVIENMTVAFREQLVRHRNAAYWLQTSRINDYSNLYDDDRFRTPVKLVENSESDDPLTIEKSTDKSLVKEFLQRFNLDKKDVKGMNAEELFNMTMKSDQMVYKLLVSMGFKMEDVRELLPYSRLERGSVTMDLRAWKHVFKARSCWIAFSAHWIPVLKQMRSQMVSKVSTALSSITNPPCLDSSCKFKHCPYELDMRKRYLGEDPLEICPLYTLYEWSGDELSLTEDQLSRMAVRLSDYEDYWSFWDSLLEDLADKFGSQ